MLRSGAQSAHAYDWTNAGYYYNTYWGICNYDLSSWSQGPGCSKYASTASLDHPVTIVFTGNSSFSRVGQALCDAGYCNAGSVESASYYGYGGNVDHSNIVEGSNGQKNATGCSITTYHARVYGDYNGPGSYGRAGSLYDPYWQHFNFATTHEDYHENCPDAATGFEEDAAYVMENAIERTGLYYVGPLTYSWTWFNNQQDSTQHNAYSPGSHFYGCDSNGILAYAGYWYSDPGTVSDDECAQSNGYADEIQVVN